MNRAGIAFCASLIIGSYLPAVTDAQEVDEEIVVIGVTPNRGAGLPEEKIPYNVQSASSDDLDRSQSLDLADFLKHNLGSVTINDAQNNALQPDIQYRGYTSSPLLGLAQGMAVYQNGVRINEPLGDTVNWDLLPESAIYSIDLISGANPLFGLNTLGGALSVEMKDGFNSEGHNLEVYGGSFERIVTTAESGGNNGSVGYYANVHYFDEEGWRDESASDAINFYGGLSWRGAMTSLNLNAQHGDSYLVGNGAIPEELLAVERDAIFTAPDITENNMIMVSLDGNHDFTDDIKVDFNFFYRENDTDSFNGDGSEFGIEFDEHGTWMLVDEDDDDDDDDGNGDDDDDNGHDGNGDDDNGNDDDDDNGDEEEFVETYGDGDPSGIDIVAINNTSRRKQESYGTDIQLSFLNDLFGKSNQLIMGFSYYSGESRFNAETEIADMDRLTRSTLGLGSGVFLVDALTMLKTETQTASFYFMNVMEVTDQLALTVSGRLNNTLIDLEDQSGERPELNGEHDYFRFNPAVGLTWQATDNMNFYGSYSESSRAPTPIELACNDSVFTRAVIAARNEGEDEDDIEFECRLPNAFLADPPLEDVVTKSFEAGLRGSMGLVDYHLGLFHATNNDDILFQTTGRATGLFANVDKTRRLGFEGMLEGSTGKIDWFIAYTYLEATFEDEFDAVSSSNHSFSAKNESGDRVIKVSPGDRIPGLPEHSLKMGADYLLFERLDVGFDVIYNSNQVLRGDESNQLDPVDGYAVVNLRANYKFNENIALFARVTNLFDADYESFGLLGEEPNEVPVVAFEDFESPRFLGPGAPRAGFVGIKLSM